MEKKQLNNQNLASFADRVSIPCYDRKAISTGIVHIGIGGFHRAHQAFYIDQVVATSTHRNWGICGIALLPSDVKIIEVLNKQDGLYTVLIKEFDGTITRRIIGSITNHLLAPENPQKVIKQLADVNVKIITLTITEGGYNFNESTLDFDETNPLIQQDIAHPHTPKTVFGYLTQALIIRKSKGHGGCTIQSCDNIPENGHMTKKMLLSYMRLAAPELIPWVTANVTFPNSMVDRITPATTEEDIKTFQEKTGIIDEWPVVCESYKQWIVEDNFANGRPPLETVGVQFVEDVVPFENMKLRLLNGGHSAIGILGALLEYQTIDKALENQRVFDFVRLYLDTEVTPTLEKLADFDVEKYKSSLLKRFGNKHIEDQVSRICSQSSAKIPKFILPVIQHQIVQKKSVTLASLIIAAWALYSLGTTSDGHRIQIIDDKKDLLGSTSRAAYNRQDPKSFLTISSIFGDLINSKYFIQEFTKSYRGIREFGLENWLSKITETVKAKNL